MTDQDVFFSHDEATIYELRQENERLRAALQKLHEGLAWDWRGHPVGDLPTLREIARTALQGDAP